MCSKSRLNELARIRGLKNVGETGGSHNQKGIEFQRHWSILRMIEIEESQQDDFLFLFEAIQDVSILDSEFTPTTISVNQIKKKDRNEWTWNQLIAQSKPPDKPPKKPKLILEDDILAIRAAAVGSAIGKLHSTVSEFSELAANGVFISNAGCDVPTADGNTYATSSLRTLEHLPSQYRTIINRALSTEGADYTLFPDLSRLSICRSPLPVEDPATFVTGKMLDFLNGRSPPHAGQARSLVQALLLKIAPLGARTDTCFDFAELRKQHGFSRSEFLDALGALEEVPDYLQHLDHWIDSLSREGFGAIDAMKLKRAASSVFRDRLRNNEDEDEVAFLHAVSDWIERNPSPIALLPYVTSAMNEFSPRFTSIERSRLMALFTLKVIEICVVQS